MYSDYFLDLLFLIGGDAFHRQKWTHDSFTLEVESGVTLQIELPITYSPSHGVFLFGKNAFMRRIESRSNRRGLLFYLLYLRS